MVVLIILWIVYINCRKFKNVLCRPVLAYKSLAWTHEDIPAVLNSPIQAPFFFLYRFAIAPVTHAIVNPTPMPLKYILSTRYPVEMNIMLRINSRSIRTVSILFKTFLLHAGISVCIFSLLFIYLVL